MNTYLTLLLGIILGAILRTIFAQLRKNRIWPGDIVLYVNPDGPLEERNLVTLVLSIIPEYGNAIIRVNRTTLLVSQKNLQVLKLDRASPLRVPEKPFAEVTIPGQRWEDPTRYAFIHEGEKLPEGARGICSPGNRAGFTPIPLTWLPYGVGIDESGKLVTTL